MVVSPPGPLFQGFGGAGTCWTGLERSTPCWTIWPQCANLWPDIRYHSPPARHHEQTRRNQSSPRLAPSMVREDDATMYEVKTGWGEQSSSTAALTFEKNLSVYTSRKGWSSLDKSPLDKTSLVCNQKRSPSCNVLRNLSSVLQFVVLQLDGVLKHFNLPDLSRLRTTLPVPP
eukprot:g67099.t1